MENENSKLLHVFIAGLREYPTAGIIARTVPTGRTDRTYQAFYRKYLVVCVQNAEKFLRYTIEFISYTGGTWRRSRGEHCR